MRTYVPGMSLILILAGIMFIGLHYAREIDPRFGFAHSRILAAIGAIMIYATITLWAGSILRKK